MPVERLSSSTIRNPNGHGESCRDCTTLKPGDPDRFPPEGDAAWILPGTHCATNDHFSDSDLDQDRLAAAEEGR